MSEIDRPLAVALGDYPIAKAIRERADERFAFPEVRPVTKTFKPMLDGSAYDICEMASVTLLQAKAHGRPVHMLPVTMLARFQQRTLVYNAEFGKPTVDGLAGRPVGVRSYAQTTGAWVRGLLAYNYGVDLKAVNWISFEDAHVAEFRDPEGVTRAGEGTVVSWLQEGRLDAAIIGNELPKDDPRLLPVLADPEGDAFRWHAQTGVVPVNHVVVVDEETLSRRPEAVGDFYRLALDAKRGGGAKIEQGVDMNPIGVEAMAPSLAFLIRVAAEQGLVPASMKVEDLFDPRIREICS